jgi:hypothetical protein
MYALALLNALKTSFSDVVSVLNRWLNLCFLLAVAVSVAEFGAGEEATDVSVKSDALAPGLSHRPRFCGAIMVEKRMRQTMPNKA